MGAERSQMTAVASEINDRMISSANLAGETTMLRIIVSIVRRQVKIDSTIFAVITVKTIDRWDYSWIIAEQVVPAIMATPRIVRISVEMIMAATVTEIAAAIMSAIEMT